MSYKELKSLCSIRDDTQRLENTCEFAESWPICGIDDVIDLMDAFGTALILAGCKSDFYDHSDMAAPLRAFNYAYEHHFTIPLWTKYYLSTLFGKYLDGAGEKRLDEVLFLNSGKKNNPFFCMDRLMYFDEVSLFIFSLNKEIGFTLPVIYCILSVKGFQGKVRSENEFEKIYKE